MEHRLQWNEGKAEGKAEEKLETARKLINYGDSIEKASQITGISIDALKREIQKINDRL
jgi:transposase-like protein